MNRYKHRARGLRRTLRVATILGIAGIATRPARAEFTVGAKIPTLSLDIRDEACP